MCLCFKVVWAELELLHREVASEAVQAAFGTLSLSVFSTVCPNSPATPPSDLLDRDKLLVRPGTWGIGRGLQESCLMLNVVWAGLELRFGEAVLDVPCLKFPVFPNSSGILHNLPERFFLLLNVVVARL